MQIWEDDPEIPADRLPADMAQSCPAELPLPRSGSVNDLKSNHIDTAEIYHACKERHNGTVEWIRNREK
ncbi:hypothetical protein [Solemya pervernicosa gill symbiont]|nr:hypothetical protein [Solemya pervernicosa gill symbiont]